MNQLTTQQNSIFDLTPTSLAEAMEFSKLIASSDVVPKIYINKPGNVLVAVQMGAELGLKPMQALQGIAVVNGNPTIWGDAMWALIISHPEYVDSKEEKTDTKCTIYLERRGRTPVTVSFSMEDAKKAGLAGKQGPWQTAPRRMMQLRARAFAARDLFADALKGIKTTEEVRDYPPEPERNMGAAEVVTEPNPELEALIKQASAAAVAGTATYAEFWAATGKENRKLLAEHHETFKQASEKADRDAAADVAPAADAAPAGADDVDPFVTGLDAAQQ